MDKARIQYLLQHYANNLASKEELEEMFLLLDQTSDNDVLHNAVINDAETNETEIEFLRLSSSDMTYKEIATIMKMTPRKIDHYRDNLFDKLDVKSRVGLAMYTIKNGLITF